MDGVKDSRGGRYSKNAVLEVFELLWKETDDAHGLTVPEILLRLRQRHERLGDDDYQAPGERTVRDQLHWLRDNPVLGRHIGHIGQKDMAGLRERQPDAKPGWFMAPYLEPSEMRLLVDSLMLARINDDMMDSMSDRLAALAGYAGHDAHGDLRVLSHVHELRIRNNDFLHTIECLDWAIEHAHAVTFLYCDYRYAPDSPVHAMLTPRQHADGTPRTYTVDPYGLVYKNGRYYLVGHMHMAGRPGLTCFVADRIRDMNVMEHADGRVRIPLERWRADGTLRDPAEPADRNDTFDPVGFVRDRPYLTMGRPVDVEMLVKPAMMNNVFEWFDGIDEPQPIRDKDSGKIAAFRVRVRCPELAMLWWTMQYSTNGMVRIIAPQSLRDDLFQAGKWLIKYYRPQSDANDDKH